MTYAPESDVLSCVYDACAGYPNPPPLPQPYELYAKCYCEENAYILAAHLDRICQRRNLETLLGDGEASPWHWDVDVAFVSNKDKTVALWEQRASQMPETDNIVIWDYHVFVIVTCRPTTQIVARQRANMAEVHLGTEARTPPSRFSSRSMRLPRGRSNLLLRRRNTFIDDTNLSNPTSAVLHDEDGLSRGVSWVYDLDSCLPCPSPLSVYLQSTFKADRRDAVAQHFRPQFRIVSSKHYLAHFASDRSHMMIARTQEEEETEQAVRASVGWIIPERPIQWSAPPPRWSLIRGPRAETGNKLMDAYVDMTARRVVSDDGRHGFIVTLPELMQGMGLGGDAHVRLRTGFDPREEATAADQEQEVDAGVAELIDRLESSLRRQSDAGIDRPSSRGHGRNLSGLSRRRASTNDLMNVEGAPGFLLGVRRIYGVRPPPPVPGEERFARLDFTGRGKRVSSPLFPAYMHATLQSRAARLDALASQNGGRVAQ